MIRIRALFYLALVAAALAVARRHASRLDEWFFSPGTIAGYLPEPSLLLGVAVILAILSLIPFSLFSSDARRQVQSRRQFKKESFGLVKWRVDDMCAGSHPDVPLIIDYIIFQAIEAGASDIHLDPHREGFRVLFRIDGNMSGIAEVPAHLKSAITNRLKVLSNLVVYQGFLPQDGRLDQNKEGAKKGEEDNRSMGAEFRIAFMPTLHGERIVIRILGRAGSFQRFRDLGMSEEEEAKLQASHGTSRPTANGRLGFPGAEPVVGQDEDGFR